MPFRFVIIGCGNVASRHAEQIVSFGTLAGVCDIEPGRAAAFADRYACKAYLDINELLELERPDIAVVCTPNGLHSLHAVLSLRAGCHVLCEKPLSISVSSGLEMIRAAHDSGRRLFVVKQNRYNPPVKAVRKLFESGRLGRITSFEVNCFWNRPEEYYQSSWRGTRALDGGTLFTQFSHFIDLLFWFAGEIDTVSGFRANFTHGRSIEFEDTGAAVLKMKSGAIGTVNYTINAHGSNMEGSLALFGEKGSVRIGGQYLNRLDYFSVEGEGKPEVEDGNSPNRYGFYEGSMSNHGKVYEELIKALSDPAHEFMEASEALKSVEMIERIYASSPLSSL